VHITYQTRRTLLPAVAVAYEYVRQCSQSRDKPSFIPGWRAKNERKTIQGGVHTQASRHMQLKQGETLEESRREQAVMADSIDKLVEAKAQGMEERMRNELQAVRGVVRSLLDKSTRETVDEDTM
jgi:hypothetical protein